MVFGKENTFEEAEQVADRMFRKFRRQDQVEVSGVPEGAVVQGSGSGNKGDEKISFEVDLKRPLGLILREIAGYGVYVDAVTAEGSAKAAGVQRGDKITATSATMSSSQMWEKNSMEGVMSAVNSAALVRGQVRIRFQRDPVLASIVCTGDESKASFLELPRALISVEKARLRVQETAREEFEVTLQLPGKSMKSLLAGDLFDGRLPYGLHLVERTGRAGERCLEVADVVAGGTAAESSGLIRAGDQVVATQASVGDQLWPQKSLAGVSSAVQTRIGRTFTLRFSREVQLGKWEQSGSVLVKASPQDKTAYFSTSGVGLTAKKYGSQGKFAPVEVLPEASEDLVGNKVRPPKRHSRATALSVLPDEAGWDLVQEVRMFHDRNVNNWPPHLNVIHPFVRKDSFLLAADLVAETLAAHTNFTLKMKLFYFKHHADCSTVMLIPDDESLAHIKTLQGLLRPVFPECGPAPKFMDYMPHMTLGQFPNEAAAKTFVALVQNKFKGFAFPVKSLYLIAKSQDAATAVDQLRVTIGLTPSGANLTTAIEEYASLRRAGVEADKSTTRSVLMERISFDLAAHGKAGNVTAINALYQEMKSNSLEMDTKLLNALMMAAIQALRPDLAVRYFEEMAVTRRRVTAPRPSDDASSPGSREMPRVDPNIACYTTLVKALGRVGDLQKATAVVERMSSAGPPPTIRVINALLEAAVQQGNLTAAQTLFSSLRGVRGEGFAQFLTPSSAAGVAIALQPSVVSFNIMINAYARAKLVDRAFKLLLEMRRANCTPNVITYTTLVKACVSAGQMDRAKSLLSDMDDLGIAPDCATYNAILKGLAAKLRWMEAGEMLEKMEISGVCPDVLSYSYVISACVRARKVQQAEKVLKQMQTMGILPNQYVYSTMMAGYGQRGLVDRAQTLIKLMQERKMRPNEFTMSALIEAYLKRGLAPLALEVFEKLQGQGFRIDVVLATQAMRAHAMKGDVPAALTALAKVRAVAKEGKAMGVVGPVVYNELIRELLVARKPEAALTAFQEMLSARVVPNHKTFVSLSQADRALAGMARVEFCLNVVGMAREAGHTPMGPLYVETLTAAVDAGELDLGMLLMQDAGAGGFAIGKQDRKSVKEVELRVINVHKASRQGQWDYRAAESRYESLGGRIGSGGVRPGAGGRIGSGGRIGTGGGGASTGYDEDLFDFEGLGSSSKPEDRRFKGAEWW